MADKSLFNRLKRLFSTNVVIRNIGGKQLKVTDTERIQSFSDLNTNFLKSRGLAGFHSTVGRYGYNELATISMQRLVLFRDYDLMESDPIIASALDVYADESSVRNEFGDILTIKTDDDKIKSILNNLFYDILNIEFNIWPWIRTLCKYGDHFLKLEISENYGIVNVIPISPYEMTREEGFDPENPFRVKFKHEGLMAGQLEYENYEIAHFRLANDPNFLPYGKSMIESGRRVWKQLQLMEDAMLIHRIMRAPEKRIFRIDTGNIPPNETEQYIKSIVNKIKKVPYVDPRTGEYNLKYNMINMTEDFFIPVRGGDSGTNIESLPGLEYNAIEDIEYLRNKMMAALKIPKAFLGYEEGIAGKATLAAEDVRFARTIERIQKIFLSELTKIAVVHLYVQGFKDEDIVNFELQLTNPSTIYEQEKVALWQEKIGLVRDMQEIKLLSNDWIYKHILNLSEDEIESEKKRVLDDIKNIFRHAQIENEGNDPFITNQTFGTPHDLAAMQKGLANEPSRKIDFGTTNFKMDWDDSTGKEKNETDDKNYDKKYNEEQREPSRSKFGQDSHVRGRDPIGKQQYSKSLSRDTRKGKLHPATNINRESLDSLLNKIKTKEVISESLKNDDVQENTTENDDKNYLNENNLLNLDE